MIQQGDYIELAGLTEDQHRLAALAFIKAGASGEDEDENYGSWADWHYMEWDGDGDLWHTCNKSKRKLSLFDVIGDAAIYWGYDGGKVAVASERKGIRAIKHHPEMKVFKGWKVVAYSPDLLAEAHKMNKDYDMQLEPSEEWNGEGEDIAERIFWEFDSKQHSASSVRMLFKDCLSEYHLSRSAHAAPPSEEWDGEGLPPIGLKCEFRTRLGGVWTGWTEGFFCSGYDSGLWVKNTLMIDSVCPARDVEFRKIETEEDKRVTELAEQLCADGGAVSNAAPWGELTEGNRDAYRDLIKMGWSKA